MKYLKFIRFLLNDVLTSDAFWFVVFILVVVGSLVGVALLAIHYPVVLVGIAGGMIAIIIWSYLKESWNRFEKESK